MRSKRKSLLHKTPADFSTASGENSGSDGANSRQNQGVSAVPTGAPVALWRQAYRPMRACHTGALERAGWCGHPPQALTDPDVPDSGIWCLRAPDLLCADGPMHDSHSGTRRLHQGGGQNASSISLVYRVSVQSFPMAEDVLRSERITGILW